MSAIKEYYHDYLSAEEFDNMFDDEYELWIKEQELKINQIKEKQNDGTN